MKLTKFALMLPFMALILTGVVSCDPSASMAEDASVDAGDASIADAMAPTCADLDYPEWVLGGSCDEVVLGPPILDLSSALDDGLAHVWIAGLPGDVYSEVALHIELRCVLRRACALHIRYINVFLYANGFAVSGTFGQALELSRDPRLERISVDSGSSLTGP